MDGQDDNPEPDYTHPDGTYNEVYDDPGVDGDDNYGNDDTSSPNGDVGPLDDTEKSPSQEAPEDVDIDALLAMADRYTSGSNNPDGNNSGDGGSDDESSVGGGADGVEDAEDVLAAIPNIDNISFTDAMNELPVWASEENKALNEMIKRKTALLAETRQTIQENVDRVAVMKEHLKNVRTEHSHTQALLEAKRQEVEEEHHLQKLSERTLGRMRGDVARTKQDMSQIQDSLNQLQSHTLSANEKLDKYRAELQWNQEELLQWSLAAKQKEEDVAAIARYQEQDNAVVVQLTEKLKRTSRLAHASSQALEKHVTETKALQVELDALSAALRDEHRQRQEMLSRWSVSVKALQRRDEQVVRMGEEMQSLRQEYDEGMRVLGEHEKQLRREKELHEGGIRMLAQVERELAKHRGAMTSLRNEVQELQDMIASHRGESEKLTAEVNACTFLNANLADLQSERTRKLDEYRQLVRATQEQLQSGVVDTRSLQEKAQAMAALHTRHEQRLQALERELQTRKKALFASSSVLFSLREKEAEVIAEMSALQTAVSNYHTRIRVLDGQALQKQEMLYAVEFRVQQLERAVSKAAGKRSVEDTMLLTAALKRVQAQVSVHEREYNMLCEQVNAVEEELRVCRVELRACEKARVQAHEEVVRLQLEVDTSGRVYKESVGNRNNLVLRHAGVSVEAEKVGVQLASQRERVRVLQEREEALSLSVREKEKEMSTQERVMRSEVCAAEEARGAVWKDVRQIQMRYHTLQCRYAVLRKVVRIGDGDGGGDMAEEDDDLMLSGNSTPTASKSGLGPGVGVSGSASVLLRVSQMREELQQEGDRLNEAIRRKEKELLLLAKTLESVKQRGNSITNTLSNTGKSGDSMEARVLHELDNKYSMLRGQVSEERLRLRELSTEYERRRSMLALLCEEVGVVNNECMSCISRVDTLEKELATLRERVRSVCNMQKQASAVLRNLVGVGKSEVCAEEVYVSIMERRKRMSVAKEMLSVLLQQHHQLREEWERSGGSALVPLIDATASTNGGSSSGSSSSNEITMEAGKAQKKINQGTVFPPLK